MKICECVSCLIDNITQSRVAICRAFVLVVVSLFLWFLFEDLILELFVEYVVGASKYLTFNAATDVCFFITAAFCIYTICKLRRTPSIATWLHVFAFVIIYSRYRFGDFGFVSLPQMWIGLGYSDIVVLALMLYLLISLGLYIKQIFGVLSDTTQACGAFLLDQPISNFSEDKLGYKASVEQLTKRIVEHNSNSSLSIGVVGLWRGGKSSYLNLLSNSLKTQRDKEFTVIKFNPRHSRSAAYIQEDFFDMLFSELDKHTFSPFMTLASKYLEAINAKAESKTISSILSIYKILDKESLKEKLDSIIGGLSSRVVIIIEDLDRLLADEIIEVFKIIDGTASFNNTTFITAYDKEHINEIIGGVYQNEHSNFSEKFFDAEIQIPIIPYYIIYNCLGDELLPRMHLNEEEQIGVKNELSKNLKVLQQHIQTIRDVKRFVNQFVAAHTAIKGEVDFCDFLIIQIIKYKFHDEYIRLSNREYLDFSKFPHITVDKDAKCKCKGLLEILFPTNYNYKTEYRSINYNKSFDIYFQENMFDKLSVYEIKELLSLGDSEIISVISGYNEEQMSELIYFVKHQNMATLQSGRQFEAFLIILICLSNIRSGTLISQEKLKSILLGRSNQDYMSIYGYTASGYEDMIKAKFVDVDNPSPPFELLSYIYESLTEDEENDCIFSEQELKNITFAMSAKYVNEYKTSKPFDFCAIYGCVYDIDSVTHKVTLDPRICKIASELFESSPEMYFKDFVRLGGWSTNKEWNSIACEPFYDQIFGSTGEFGKFVQSYNGINADRVKNFWQLYEANEYEHLHYQNQGCVQDKIDSNLSQEIEAWRQLQEIKEKVFSSKHKELLQKIGRILPNNGAIRKEYNKVVEGVKK